jgi:NADH-quinone oxidoreductase subunit E
MHTMVRENPTASERAFIDGVIANYSDRPGALLGILETIQESNPRKYLPKETLRYVAAKSGIPPSQVFSVATFFALFNLQPQGDNTICICRGTACHTRGSRDLLDSLQLEFGMGQHHEDESVDGLDADKVAITTADQRFTVRTVACFGQCAQAPVVEINHNICGHVNEHTLRRQVRALERGGK